MLSSRIFHSRIKSDQITGKEKFFGYFLGPVGFSLMISFLGSYLNVYFTDVLSLGSIGNGIFLSTLPLVSTILTVFTTLRMGRLVDQTKSPQGKARPWILLSAPILILGYVLLFTSPDNNHLLTGAWIFLAYLLFYSIGNVSYNAGHSLMLPLSTANITKRSQLSPIVNAVGMVSGTMIAVIFPSMIIPRLGVNHSAWFTVAITIAIIALPLIFIEYYYTRERVSETTQKTYADPLSFWKQLRLCFRSRQWLFYFLYILISQLLNLLSNASIFYYCNWVLGSYNDGITQVLFYAIGNAPLGIGVFLCQPLCRIFGRKRAMMYGFLLSAVGCILCLLNPTSLPLVLLGQFIKATGLIPSTFLVTTLLADALDDVERTTGRRLDGFSSSIFSIMGTLAGGAATAIFNFFLTRLGYIPPIATSTLGVIPSQPASVQGFFIFCVLVAPLISSLLLAFLMKASLKAE